MAEYYPLLDRAVSGLTEPTAEARRSIYERARTALIGQLRRMEPPVPEDDIARESAALDAAIARVEARFDDRGPAPVAEASPPMPAPQPRAEPTPQPRAEPTPPAIPAPTAAAAPTRVPPPPLPTGAPPVVPPPSRERPVLGPRPAPAGARLGAAAPAAASAPPVRPGPGSPPRASSLPRGTRPVMALRPVVPAPERDAPGVSTAKPAADAPLPERDAPAAGPNFADALDAAGRAERDGALPDAPAAAAARPRDGTPRPPAPRPRDTSGWSRPVLLAALVAGALAMAGMGFAAYRLRDTPEQVVASRTAAQGAPTAEAAAPGKMAERAAPADAAGDAASPATSGAAVPAVVPQGLDTGGAGPSIAVAQRAALLVDAPDDPQRVHTYVGTVVWHLDSVSPGGGQPLASAVKADIDIPDAKLKVSMLMQKNPEPQLPASHTIEFHFLPQGGNVLGPVKQVNVPEMRKDDDAPTGDALAGVPVAITDNYFLVGLTRGAAETQNLRLMTERNWFDMSVLFTSGKLGKLTFEKGAAGQRVIEDAFKTWK
ncbi:hypothetical protein D3273_07155 [Lichenibacterium minor]|uniref:Uncharacterized protein n=1 Tax=Lichenibacterium minor TaxID=2316528 RepID=A0A4Q2UC74_9HYPH|nr:hypothetical protein [Lichenibacterium minor]RYC32851.1 hypothetical protein D3273_07155 [Lichenibacterium minor]